MASVARSHSRREFGTMNNLSFGGDVAGKAFAYYETIAGGMGASPRGDGYSATHTT